MLTFVCTSYNQLRKIGCGQEHNCTSGTCDCLGIEGLSYITECVSEHRVSELQLRLLGIVNRATSIRYSVREPTEAAQLAVSTVQ